MSPTKDVMRVDKKVKLSRCFIIPFEVLIRVRNVAYRLALPPILVNVHPVFHDYSHTCF